MKGYQMKGICGWLGSLENGESVIRAMASRLGSNENGLIGQNGGLAGCSSNETAYRQGVLAGISGHPRFGAGFDEIAKSEGAGNALVRLYLEHGEKGFEKIAGDFSAAIIDEREGKAILAIDRLGIGRMNYSTNGDSVVFGSSLDSIRRHPLGKGELNPQAIYDYVYFHMIPGPETIYSGQYRLLPGQYLVFKGGSVEIRPYWEMRFEERILRPFGELKKEFLDTLRLAVKNAAEGAETGAFLSGGTDSSTVSGLLKEVTGRARTYSIGFEAEGYDEMSYARIAAKRFGTEHHEYYVTPGDVAAAIPKIASRYDQPFGNSSAVPTYYCAKLAREDGIERMLGGDGGDELFGGNTRYAKQRVFSFYQDIPKPFRRFLIEPIAFGLPGFIPPVRKLRSYIEQASVPMPGRMETYNLLERLGPSNLFTKEFLEKVDGGNPLRLLEGIYNGAHANTMLNRMLALDLKFTLADNDLPKVTETCFHAGVDIAYPMLDDGVVAFSARLDPALKLKGLKLRYFFKEALRGFLPDEIITKSKHGFGLPFGEWMKHDGKLQEIARDSLDSLKRRGIINPGFIDELMKLHEESHSGYYGTMVWVLMMLEQWFRQHLSEGC